MRFPVGIILYSDHFPTGGTIYTASGTSDLIDALAL